MTNPHSPSSTERPPATELERHYRTAADDARSMARGLSPSDVTGRMRAVVDAIWTHLSLVGVSWVGFYLPSQEPDGSISLVLGPSRNTPACSPIGLHGVCGQAFIQRVVRIVPDVRALGDHYVACDPRDRSEIVIPIIAPPDATAPEGERTCLAVLDLDSHDVGRFTQADAEGLLQVLKAAGFSAFV